MQKINDHDVEKLLSSLPRVERDPQHEALFFEKLNRLAQKKELPEKNRHTWRHTFRFPQFVAVITAALLIIFTGSFAWAYQSSVTRGTFLYPLKQMGERVELAFARSPFQKVETHLKFGDRRFEEAGHIVERHPTLLAGALPVAKAHEDEIHLDTEEKLALAETLRDMRGEVTAASVIIEQSMTKPVEVEKALGRIELATDRHVEGLKKLEKKTKKEVKQIIRLVADEEDAHLATVVEAQEEVKEAMAAKREAITVRFQKREEKETDRKKEAEQEVKATLELFAKLSKSEKKKFELKIEMVQEALKQEKFGRALGLSRALQNRMESKKNIEVEKKEELEGQEISGAEDD